MAESRPSGVDLNANRTPNIIASVTVLWVIGIVAVALRFAARRRARTHLGWDDWLVFFAMALPFSGTCIANYVGASLGAGKHIELILVTHPENLGPFLQYSFAVELLYPWILGPLKCSVLILFVRLFGVNRPFRWYCYSLMLLVVVWAIALELGSAFQCTPVWQAWNPYSDRSMCVNLQRFLVGFNVPNIVLDFLVLTAPVYMIWRLSLPRKRKLIVGGILMLDIGETVFSIVRLATLTSLDTSDATWNYFGAIVWSTVEQSIGILCVCLPVLGPLMPAWFIGASASDYDKPWSGDSRSRASMPAGAVRLRSTSLRAAADDRAHLTTKASDDAPSDRHEPRGIRQTTELHIEHDPRLTP